ncbi:MAG: hypothetical protein JNL87_04095 [Burkholderiaceae bacterium]|nr:hypothetical protein [Burkholderiaceae bacterium]
MAIALSANRFRTPGALHWRAFADEWVVMFEAGGVVCGLDAFNATVLSLIESGSGTAADVAARVAEAAGVDCDDPLIRKVTEVCDELERSGMIETDDI